MERLREETSGLDPGRVGAYPTQEVPTPRGRPPGMRSRRPEPRSVTPEFHPGTSSHSRVVAGELPCRAWVSNRHRRPSEYTSGLRDRAKASLTAQQVLHRGGGHHRARPPQRVDADWPAFPAQFLASRRRGTTSFPYLANHVTGSVSAILLRGEPGGNKTSG